MPLHIIGDIHGDFWTLKRLLQDIPKNEPVIQVGDLGIWPATAARWKSCAIDRDVHFIDGNHDYIPWLDADSKELIEIWPHAIYVPRGHVVEFDVGKVLFLGGSKSVDRAFRRKDSTDHGWFEAEQLTLNQATRALARVTADGPIDYMITHTPPDSVIRKNFSEEGLKAFGINPKTWVDESARLVEKVWQALGMPQLYCGHMHRKVVEPKVRILDIYEVLCLNTAPPANSSVSLQDQ